MNVDEVETLIAQSKAGLSNKESRDPPYSTSTPNSCNHQPTSTATASLASKFSNGFQTCKPNHPYPQLFFCSTVPFLPIWGFLGHPMSLWHGYMRPSLLPSHPRNVEIPTASPRSKSCHHAWSGRLKSSSMGFYEEVSSKGVCSWLQVVVFWRCFYFHGLVDVVEVNMVLWWKTVLS